MAYRSVRNGVGTSANPFTLSAASTNYTTQYFKCTNATGDIRGYYLKNSYTGAGGGEVIRAVGAANGLLCATGGTINAAHFTGRVEAAKTVSGALNAVRATLEVAGTTPTPGGTLSALQLDTNIVTGWTEGSADAFVRVTNSGAGILHQLLSLPAVGTGLMVATHSSQTNTHSIKILVGGVQYYIPIHATATGLS